MNIYKDLERRGLIAQSSHPEEIERILQNEQVTFYIGFDATAQSLHVGHFLQLIVMRHMQLAGHRPIVLLGTGTTMVGDPTGRTDMRQMLTVDQINYNADRFKAQMSKYLDFEDDRALFVRNGDWLLALNYVEMLRDVGVHFSVNRMLATEGVRTRLERGLSFLEFNYAIMQAYDFLHLYRNLGCTMQFGGADQWSNILAGVDLIRRVEQGDAYCVTFSLLTNSEGQKMGKTANGALWIDPDLTPPYEFFQYWRNIDDADVIKCLKMLTFLPIEQIEAMEGIQGSEFNAAKELLAFEVTKLVHGEANAQEALEASKALFGAGADSEHIPTAELTAADFTAGELPVIDLLVKAELAASKGEARRLIEQGGISIDDVKVDSITDSVTLAKLQNGPIVVKKGKKVFKKVVLA